MVTHTTTPDLTAPAPSLTVIGAAAGMPRPGWPSSGYLVHTDGGAILLDCGPGTAGVAASVDLSAVLITHLHVDHCLDVLVLAKALSMHAVGRRIPVYLPQGGEEALRAANRLFPLAPEGPGDLPTDDVFSTVLEPRRYEPGHPFRIDGAVITPVAMRHRQPCCGFQVDAPLEGTCRRIAYTGDTGDTEAITALAADADLFVCEATLTTPDTTGHGHLSAAQAGTHAAAANVGRLLLTHFTRTDQASLDAQRRAAALAYDGPIDVARPGRHYPA